MKLIIYILFIVLVLQGCEKDVEYQYDDIDRVYFEYEYKNSKDRLVTRDSVIFSFGKHPENVMVDTAKIVVKLLGNPSEVGRTYKVEVVEAGKWLIGKTDMVAGVDYEALKDEYVFGPDRLVDTLRIVVFREHLSTSLRNPQSKTLMLRLVTGGDLQLGIDKGREMKLSLNNILTPPAWWEANETLLGFYHPKKWRKLIELDPIFAVEDAFAGTGVDMQKKAGILKGWLENNVIIDEETGMRIMMDGLVDVE